MFKVSEKSTLIIRQFGDWSSGDKLKHTRNMISKAKNFQRSDFGVSFSSKNTQEKTLVYNVIQCYIHFRVLLSGLHHWAQIKWSASHMMKRKN